MNETTIATTKAVLEEILFLTIKLLCFGKKRVLKGGCSRKLKNRGWQKTDWDILVERDLGKISGSRPPRVSSSQ